MNKKATKSLDFKFSTLVTKDAGGECIIEGYANTSSKDRVGDVVVPEAFAKSLETYRKNPVVLLNHDWNNVIGRCFHQEITDKGLFIKAKISNTRQDIKTLIDEGCYSTFSIGYNEIDADYDESTKTKYIKELELLEISVVSVPANTEAMFTQATEKTESADPSKKDDEEKSAKKASTLKALISDAKEVVGKSFDDEALFAVIDYFNSEKKEEIMTKEEMIKLLKVKSAAPMNDAAPAAKQDEAAPDQSAGDPLKELSAKLDVIAQAMGQLMEKIEQMSKPAEDKPSEEKPAAEEPAKEDEEEKECDEEMKDEEEKELDLDEVNKTIAELGAQIDALDEEVNG